MKHYESYLHRFLTKFSYTTKIRFILSIGYFTATVLLIMNFILLLGPLKDIHEQKIGLEYLKELSLIADKIQAFLLMQIQTQQKKSMESSITEELHHFAQRVDAWIKTSAKDRILWDNFNAKMGLFSHYWDQLKDQTPEKHSLHLVEGFYTTYLALIEQISLFSNLAFNLDTGTSYLINALNRDLPGTQKGILVVQLSKFHLHNEFNQAKEKLIESDHQLLQEGSMAINNLTPWVKGNAADLLPGLQKYTENVSKYVKMAEIPLEGESYEPMALGLALSAKGLLENSFQLKHELQNLLLLALQSEEQEFNSVLWKCVFILLLGSAIVAGLYLTRVIRHPIENLVYAAQEMSKGNIAIRVPITTNDEVALVTEAFNQMAEYFEKILKKASVIIDQIFVTSTTISSYTKEFESNMNAQERIVRQITSHARSLQKGEEEFIEVLQRANKAASATGALAVMGHGSLHEMETIMHDMLSASSNVVATLSSLREKLVDIHQVIFTIVKIADQSNLLSLNTAIRATKSGSEGRGFVIIADKIREMAEQIAFATLDIEKVVEDIVGGVQVTVQEVERFSSQILTQVKETTEIGNQLKQLIDATQEQVTDFEKINEGMQDQTKGIIAINQVIEELRCNVQESAFAVRKLYLEIEYLYDSSYTLRDTIKKFNQ